MFKNLVLLAFSSMLFMSCGDDRVVLFDMEFEAEFEIPAGLNTIETWYFDIPNVKTFYSNFSAGTDDAAITTINAASCTIDGKFAIIDYDFIQDIYINAWDPSDISTKREVFYREDIPIDDASEIVMFGNLANMKEVLDDDLVNLEVRVNFRNTPTNLEHRLTLRFQAFEEE